MAEQLLRENLLLSSNLVTGIFNEIIIIFSDKGSLEKAKIGKEKVFKYFIQILPLPKLFFNCINFYSEKFFEQNLKFFDVIKLNFNLNSTSHETSCPV